MSLQSQVRTLDESIKFAQQRQYAARLIIESYEVRREEIVGAIERERERLAQLDRDRSKAPELLASAEADLRRLEQTRRAAEFDQTTGGHTTARKLERKRDRLLRLREQVAEMQRQIAAYEADEEVTE